MIPHKVLYAGIDAKVVLLKNLLCTCSDIQSYIKNTLWLCACVPMKVGLACTAKVHVSQSITNEHSKQCNLFFHPYQNN